MNKISHEELLGRLRYSPSTGDWVWLDTFRSAGTMSHRGYIRIMVNGKYYQSHRLAFFYMEGYWPENDIDHKDRDKTNNKWSNLRHVSHRCNMRNQSLHARNSTGITGVLYRKDRDHFVSSIRVDKKPYYLGCFGKKLDAAKARLKAEIKFGFPNCNTTSSALLYIKERENKIGTRSSE